MAEFVVRLSNREHKLLDRALKDVLSFYEDLIVQIDYTSEYTAEEIKRFDDLKKKHDLVEELHVSLFDIYSFERCELNLTNFVNNCGRKDNKSNGKKPRS